MPAPIAVGLGIIRGEDGPGAQALYDHREGISILAVSNDGRVVVSSGRDHSTRRAVNGLSDVVPPRAHHAAVGAVVARGDSKTVIELRLGNLLANLVKRKDSNCYPGGKEAHTSPTRQRVHSGGDQRFTRWRFGLVSDFLPCQGNTWD
jgi:hypothetical protein